MAASSSATRIVFAPASAIMQAFLRSVCDPSAAVSGKWCCGYWHHIRLCPRDRGLSLPQWQGRGPCPSAWSKQMDRKDKVSTPAECPGHYPARLLQGGALLFLSPPAEPISRPDDRQWQ